MEHDGVRDAVLRIYTILEMANTIPKPQSKFREMLILVWYCCTQISSRKRRSLMDIPAMVQGWISVVVATSTGHDKETVDHAEFAIEELMAPLLTAPVKQLRVFWQQLEQALKADPPRPICRLAHLRKLRQRHRQNCPGSGHSHAENGAGNGNCRARGAGRPTGYPDRDYRGAAMAITGGTRGNQSGSEARKEASLRGQGIMSVPRSRKP